MKNDVYEIFETDDNFQQLRYIDLEFVDKVFVSYDQLCGITIYDSEEQLLLGWRNAARELAFEVQRKLDGEWDGLRWDIYLLLVVSNSNVSIEERKKIENDRTYFKKIILTKDDIPFQDYWKFSIKEIQKSTTDFQLISDKDFLNELENSLTVDTKKKIRKEFFTKGLQKEKNVISTL